MGNVNNAINLGQAVTAALVGGAGRFTTTAAHQCFVEDVEGLVQKHLGGSGAAGIFNKSDSAPGNDAVIFADLARRLEQEAIFAEMLGASEVHVNGQLAVRTEFRRELIAQELINNASPSGLVIDQQLLKKFPIITLAIMAMAGDLEPWIGSPVADMANEFSRAMEPASTELVRLAGARDADVSFTLQDFWDAVRSQDGSWLIKGQHVRFAIRRAQRDN